MRFRLIIILILISVLSIIETVAQEETSGYRVAEVIELGALSGPGATATFLSPDGRYYAHFLRDSLCIYTLPENEEDSCYQLGEDFPIEFESVRWSPDGRYIAFSDNDAFRTFRDADIQLLDLESGEIRNITDDDSDARFVMQENEGDTINVDIALAWSEDNQLAILRYVIENGESIPDATTIVIVDPMNGDTETLITIPTEQSVLHVSITWHGNRIALGRYPSRPDSNSEGIDIINVESGEIEQEITVSENLIRISGLKFSPDGNYLIAYDPRHQIGRFEIGAIDGFGIIDLSTNEEVQIDAEHFVTEAGFSPDGNMIAYTVFMHPRELDGGLYIASALGEAGEQVLSDLDLSGTTAHSLGNLTWASNNMILVRNNEDFTAMLIILEVSK